MKFIYYFRIVLITAFLLSIGYLLGASFAKADVIISLTAKYGTNTSTTNNTDNISNTTTVTDTHHSSTTTTSTTASDNSYNVTTHQVTPGLRLQTVPDYLGLSLSAGYYFDSTVEAGIGIRF